jgi:uncharacterized protein (DUF433 family)
VSEVPAGTRRAVGGEIVIRETPGVCGGYPCIGDARIPVRCIVLAHRETGSFERTAAAFPQLTSREVQAALDYYAAHPARVDEDIETNEQALKEIQSRPAGLGMAKGRF